jgi:hypothetical protein
LLRRTNWPANASSKDYVQSSRLDDRELADIGISRAEILAVARGAKRR